MMVRADTSAVAPRPTLPSNPRRPSGRLAGRTLTGRSMVREVLRRLLKRSIGELRRPSTLAEGMVFEVGSPAALQSGEARWRVCKIRQFLGISHALIEQVCSGKTKTIAVSAILSDPTFRNPRPTLLGPSRCAIRGEAIAKSG